MRSRYAINFGLAGVEPRPRCGCLERKTQLDVGRREFVAGEPAALLEFRLHEVEMPLDLRVDERREHTLRDALGDGFGEKRHRTIRNAVEHELQQQRRHRRTFRVVQPVGVAQSFRRSRRGRELSLAVAFDQILDDGAGFGERQRVVGDDRRLAERVYREQRCRRQHCLGIALVALDLVLEAELFQQP